MKTAVVTGGAGFIGSHIVDMLIKEGLAVTVFDDLSSGDRANLNPKAELKVLDICSAEAREEINRIRPDVVVHAAAQISVRKSMEDPIFDTHVNVEGLVNLLTPFREGKSPYFMFLCTGGALYGEQEKFPADENHPIRPTSIYGLNKALSEHYLRFWKEQYGLRYLSLRLGNIYGPRQNPHGEAGVVAIFCKALLAGKVPTINGTGDQTRDYVFVGDVVKAFELGMKKEVTGSYNIGTGKETSVNELYNSLIAAMGLNTKAEHGPAKAGEQLRSVIDNGLAKKTFNWAPEHTTQSGLKITADWFASQSKK
jgi:UDP-glucose 4-epimerase